MTTPTREQVEALCADLDQHTEDERGYCDQCYFRWPCGVVEIRDTLRALLAETERQAVELREAHTRTQEIRDTLAEVVTGEWDTPTMAVLAVAEVKRLRDALDTVDALLRGGPTGADARREPIARIMASTDAINAARREGGA